MQVRIFRPSKTAMQSGRANTRHWLIEPEPQQPKLIDPLMGWVGTRDMVGTELRMRFPTKEEAIAYAEGQGWDYRVFDERPVRARPKSYSDNFRYDKVV